MNSPADGKIQIKAFESFSSTFQGKFNFQRLFIFKYFLSLCEPCMGNICVKLFWIYVSGSGDAFKDFF